jgi:hypothetical protein
VLKTQCISIRFVLISILNFCLQEQQKACKLHSKTDFKEDFQADIQADIQTDIQEAEIYKME